MMVFARDLIAPWVVVTLDGVEQRYVTYANEEAQTLDRYVTESGQIVQGLDGNARAETAEGKVVVSLRADAPDYIKAVYERIRAAEARKPRTIHLELDGA